MSHYISASLGENNDEGTELSYGVSWRTLSALESSGISIYGLYDATEHDAGMSGDGESVTVSSEQCENAYEEVIAWVTAMKSCYPEAYDEKYGEDNSLPPGEAEEHSKIINNHPFLPNEIEPRFNALLEDLKKYPLNEDQLDRSMGYLSPVLYFARKIYEYTATSNEDVIISFS